MAAATDLLAPQPMLARETEDGRAHGPFVDSERAEQPDQSSEPDRSAMWSDCVSEHCHDERLCAQRSRLHVAPEGVIHGPNFHTKGRGLTIFAVPDSVNSSRADR